MLFFNTLLVAFFAFFQITLAQEWIHASNGPVSRFLAPRSSTPLGAPTSEVRRAQLTKDADTCHSQGNVCAEISFGGSTQQVRTNDAGCTPIRNGPGLISITVYDCWCGLWNAADETACNNGDDERVDQFNSCAGLNKRSDLIALFSIALCDLSGVSDQSYTTDFNITGVLGANGDSGTGSPELQSAGWPDETPDPASDQVWNSCKCKGAKFLTQMSYCDYDAGQSQPNPQDTAQSTWSYADLSAWGYHYSVAEDRYCDLDSLDWGIAVYFRRIGISDKCVEEGGQWRVRSITHFDNAPDPPVEREDQTYIDPKGEVRRVTGASFVIATNPQGGIIAQDIEGPRTAADELHGPGVMPDTELPPLRRVSDMMWAMWENEIPVDRRKSLQFYVVLFIMNDITLQVLKRALESVNGPLSEKGVRFDITSEVGRAILGTPSAVGFAHFLIQHKAQLGLKTIKDVYVFQCETIHGMPCMLFSVKSLDKAVPRPPRDDEHDSRHPPSQERHTSHKQKCNIVRTHMPNRE